MKFGLKESTVKQIQSVLVRYPQVEKSVLYGSHAKGNYRNGSDIDLTLYGGEDIAHIQRVGVTFYERGEMSAKSAIT